MTIKPSIPIEQTRLDILSLTHNRSLGSEVGSEEVIEVSTPHGLAELRPTPGVPDHFPQSGFVHVLGEVLDHRFQLGDGLRLTSDHVCHDLRPDTEVQAREIRAVGRPLASGVRLFER